MEELELQEFVKRLIEQERERAAMLCHQYRDVKYPAEAIAEAILRG